ncbi:hypothetical protein [Paenibacillus dakarensis]|uniref:hypothetical protein n=1 Tax=Paenibacillus dakarensis TaxID=1527293 RepID=UPI0006D5B399|nr:hypothetical protein [Paenibacillus dakarensis]
MYKAGKKLAAIIIWAGIGVLIGMQLGGTDDSPVQNGRLFGQMVQSTQQQRQSNAYASPEPKQESAPAASIVEEEPRFEPIPRDILLPQGSKPPADVLADKTAGLLQQLSNQSIRWVVSIFGSITD